MNTSTTVSDARVVDALRATAELLPSHWQKLLASRTPGESACGSVCDPQDVPLADALAFAHWETYEHPAVMSGCVAYWTRGICGTIGIVPVSDLAEGAELEFRDAHETGYVEACVRMERPARATGTCIILGKHEGREVVFTFHPGEPIRPSCLRKTDAPERLLKRYALGMGVKYAKVIG